MGYSYGEPFITRLKDDKWVALLPNGYNSPETEDKNGRADPYNGTGNSVLFMVDVANGNLVKKFVGDGPGVKPNGMASAAVSDIPYDITGDAAFVGDLKGSVYRIDLTDTSYAMDKMADSIDPFKTAITTPIRLTQFQNFSNDTKDVMVHYGTGKFIEDEDKNPNSPASSTYQYVVGLFDRGQTSATPINVLTGDIVEQQILTEVNGLRTLSDYAVEKGTHDGWRLKLASVNETDPTGERVIAKMATRASAHFLILSSYLPTGGSSCSSGGASWVMVVDNRTGGEPEFGSILNGGTADGMFVENQVFGVTPIGFAGGGGEILIISTDSDSDCEGENCDASIVIPDFTWRRRSWHRMFQED
jgi:type IV pilus assembly protein PilY1